MLVFNKGSKSIMGPALAIVTTISMVTGDRSLGALYVLFLIGSPL